MGVGRYDGDPVAHATLAAESARGFDGQGMDSAKSGPPRAAMLVEEVRQQLLQDRWDREHGEAQALTGPGSMDFVEPVMHFHGQSVVVLVMVPWAVFAVVTALFALTCPATFWSGLAYFVILVAVANSGLLIFVHAALDKGRIYLLLGALCLVSVVLGCTAGKILYDRDMAEYWLNMSRPARSDVEPTALAASYRDASVLHFTDATRVDLHRVLGFRPEEDRLTYCVAPLLDDSQQDHVEFWAVGVDCCEPLWGFYCGDVLIPTARSGAVLPAMASSYTSRRYTRYLDAAHQAASLYHLTIAEEPVFVHWVQDPATERSRELRDGIVGVVLFCIAYLLVSLLLAAWLHWSSARRPAAGKFGR